MQLSVNCGTFFSQAQISLIQLEVDTSSVTFHLLFSTNTETAAEATVLFTTDHPFLTLQVFLMCFVQDAIDF